ncbi:MAG: radical SAM protein [Planctomycetota bacterium]
MSINQFNNFISKVESKKIPFWVHLDLTYRCNLECLHCYCQGLSNEWTGTELTTAEIFNLLDQLAEIGSLYLTLSGGEAMLRPDFFRIGHYARRRHFALTIFTNGVLIDEEKADALSELSPLGVELSIYGADEKTHDAITQRAGSFRKTIKAVGLLQRRNIRLDLKTTLMKDNFHQADAIESLVNKLGADYHFALEISPKNNGDKSVQQYQLTDKELGGFVLRQSARSPDDETPVQGAGEKPLCGAGQIGCYIAPTGDVYPCVQLLEPMGNIKTKSFRKIWFADSPIRQELAGLKTYADIAGCRNCRYVQACRRCHGLALLETGDLRGCYPTLKHLTRTHYEAIQEEKPFNIAVH